MTQVFLKDVKTMSEDEKKYDIPDFTYIEDRVERAS